MINRWEEFKLKRVLGLWFELIFYLMDLLLDRYRKEFGVRIVKWVSDDVSLFKKCFIVFILMGRCFYSGVNRRVEFFFVVFILSF